MICAAPPYQPPHDVPHYSLAVTIPAHGDVTGTETVTFRAPRTTRRIVLRLWANAPATRVAGARETAEVVRATPRVTVLGADPTTLDLRLARPLRRGARATVRLRFRLAPASGGLTRVGRARSFVRLGSFFPILALDRGGVWATDPPSILAAETSTSPTANFDVRVHGPPRWTVLTTGVRVGRGRFTAKLVRDFAIATGRLARVSVVAHAPSAVTVTAVAPSRPLAAAFAGRAALALQALSRRYGPYPWPRFGVEKGCETVSSLSSVHFTRFASPQSCSRAYRCRSSG